MKLLPLEKIFSQYPLHVLQKAAFSLHEKYLKAECASLQGMHEHLAYVLARMPATYQATLKALLHLKEVLPCFSPMTLLDLGSGPGTAMWAAREAFPALQTALGLEKSEEFLKIFHMLSKDVSGVEAKRKDLEEWEEKGFYDLVIASYSFQELSEKAQEKWLLRFPKITRALLLLFPGTPAGFSSLLKARKALLHEKACLLAPCPHKEPCPLEGTAVWCHEACRVARTSWQRKIKQASLSYEDEKFSYLVALFDEKEPSFHPPCRIIHAPSHRSGHTHLSLCTKRGTEEKYTISRKRKTLYGLVKRARWGDSFPDPKEEG